MPYLESAIEGPFGERKKSHSKNFLGKQVLTGSFERGADIGNTMYTLDNFLINLDAYKKSRHLNFFKTITLPNQIGRV